MKRSEFKAEMNNAIAVQKRGGARHHNYSCGAIWDAFGIVDGHKVHKDYEAMFKINASAYWMNGYCYSEKKLQQERMAMLQMFKQVALDGEFYERY